MPDPDSPVLFQCGRVRLDRAGLRAFASRLEREVAGGRSFEALIARDAELQQLNRDFLNHDYPTDVLSFPSGAPQGSLGEIAISFDRARGQAAEHGHTVDAELCILMLHGLLHLLGMDHETDRGKMRRLETKWRRALELPSGLIERVMA
jgi:probable rRNA maturation factor